LSQPDGPPEESLEDFVARHAKAEAREQDQSWIDAMFRDGLERPMRRAPKPHVYDPKTDFGM